MTMTTMDVVKLLPIKEELKQKILTEFDGLSLDQKFIVEQTVWTAYDAVHESHLEKNLDDEIEAALYGKKEYDNNFYTEAEKKADLELGSQADDQLKKTDLSVIRNKLQTLIQQ